MLIRRRIVGGFAVLALAAGLVVSSPVSAGASVPVLSDIPGWLLNRLGGGYRVVSTDGATWSIGGGLPNPVQTATIQATANQLVGADETPDGRSYYTVDTARVVQVFNDAGASAVTYGDLSGTVLNSPLVDIVVNTTGNGYWLISADGAVFAFGMAALHGSANGSPLPAPIVGAVRTVGGYAMVDSGGTVYSFSGANTMVTFAGASNGLAVDLAVNPGGGFFVLDVDGTVHGVGGATAIGNATVTPGTSAVSISAVTSGGYRVLIDDGTVQSFGAPAITSPALTPTAPNASIFASHGQISIQFATPQIANWAPNMTLKVYDANTFGLLASFPVMPFSLTNLRQYVSLVAPTTRFKLELYLQFVNDAGVGISDPPHTLSPFTCGYWMLDKAGKTYPFGCAPNLNSPFPLPIANAVDLEPSPSGRGYWILDGYGFVYTYGDAKPYGYRNITEMAVGEKPTGIAGTVAGKGYYIFTSFGRVYPFGDAVSYGDMSGIKLNGPVLDGFVTATGSGYYMLGSDGGVFSFGDAQFHGSTGNLVLNQPARGMVPDPDGSGYWFVAADGGVFSFDADFHGSMGATKLNKPVVGMISFGNGYLMVAADGGIFNFSSSPFYGSLGANPPPVPIVAVASTGGY